LDGLDWGDAPDGPYPTLAASIGASHFILPGFHMGNLIDSEMDGQPNPSATGDDIANLPDEDGVVFGGTMVPGGTVTIAISVSQTGFIDGWIDFNVNGSWLDPADQILASVPVLPGLNNLSIVVPAGSFGPTFARFRISTLGGLPPTGAAPDGEVEDYMVALGKRIPTGVNISTAPLTLNLNWSSEPGATSYSVHSSTVLSAPLAAWTIETPIPPGIPGLTWSELIGPKAKFYIVVAWP
jgi:hypothetical protein